MSSLCRSLAPGSDLKNLKKSSLKKSLLRAIKEHYKKKKIKKTTSTPKTENTTSGNGSDYTDYIIGGVDCC